MRPDRCEDVLNARARHRDHRAERHSAALEAARRADTEERPHPETEIERARMNTHSYEDVLVPAHGSERRALETAGAGISDVLIAAAVTVFHDTASDALG